MAKKGSIPWNKGKKLTDAQKINIIKARRNKPSFGNLGKKHSEETKRKISEAKKNKNTGNKNPFYGKQHTTETKQKISKAKLGQKHTEEAKQKISEAGKNRKCSKETRLKISRANTGRVFSKEAKLKEYATKKKKGNLNTSAAEQKILIALKNVFKNVEYQYRSEKYPFNCDFYIPELDLYIEYQGTWTHGGKPFEGNSEDLQKLNVWKEKAICSLFYKSAVEVWTIRDPLKRKTAKENNLNWIEFYTIYEFNNWLKEYEIR